MHNIEGISKNNFCTAVVLHCTGCPCVMYVKSWNVKSIPVMHAVAHVW